MKKISFYSILFLVLIFSSSNILADVIDLDDGSKIFGTIQKIDKKVILIKTSFAAILSIDMTHVVFLSSEHPLFIAFTNGNRIYGKVTHNKIQTQIEMPDGNTVVIKDALAAGWLEGMSDPLRRNWSYTVGLDLAGKTGNSEKFGTGGRIQTKLEGPDDRLLFYLRQAYAKDDGVKNEDFIIGGVDFERYFFKRHSWYARMELENDDIKEIDLRSTAALGYGWFFLKEKNHILRGRSGVLYRHESRKDGTSDSTVGIDFGISHMFIFENQWKLLNDMTFTPSLEDFHDYRIYHESAFEIPLAMSKIWKVQLGVSNDYDSQPAEDTERLDTTYFSRLVFVWE